MLYIERKNHVIKERKISPIRTFPFKNIPGQIIIEIIRFVGICINQGPSYNGVSDFYSPHNIIMVKNIAYENHCKFIYGSYVEDHEYHNIDNYME